MNNKGQELFAFLGEQGFSPSSWNNSKVGSRLNLNTSNKVVSLNSDEDGNTILVVYFEDFDIYLKAKGYEGSYSDNEFSGPWKMVTPKSMSATIYE